MVSIDFLLKGITEAIAKADGVRVRYANMTKPFKQASIVILKSVLENFRAQGRPDPWTPLSPLTLMLRRGGGAGAKILEDTGQMERGIFPFNAETNEAGEFGVAASSNTPYAVLMQKGGVSQPSDVMVPAGTRRNPRVMTASENVRYGKRRGSSNSVAAYVMHIGSHPVPARPFMMLQEEDKSVVTQIITDHLHGQ